jgi:hypothetical protein
MACGIDLTEIRGAQDRIDDAQEGANERFDKAMDRINHATGSDNNNNNLESNLVEEEDRNVNIQSLRTDENANTVNDNGEANSERDEIDDDSSENGEESNQREQLTDKIRDSMKEILSN